MKLLGRISCLLAALALLTRCEEPVDLDLEVVDPQLVLLSEFFPGEHVRIKLSSSQSILTSTDFPSVDHAVVRILLGDEVAEELTFVEREDEHTAPYYVTTELKPLVGVHYTVHVSAAGFTPATAVSSIPQPVPITHFGVSNLDYEARDHNLKGYELGIELDYEDPLPINTYYHLQLWQEIENWSLRANGRDTFINDTRIESIVFNPDMEQDWTAVHKQSGGGLLLRDKPFEEHLHLTLKGELNGENERLGRIFAEFRVVSPAYYNFQSSITRQLFSSGQAFQEPSDIEDNVDNGLGVFAGYNFARDTLSVTY